MVLKTLTVPDKMDCILAIGTALRATRKFTDRVITQNARSATADRALLSPNQAGTHRVLCVQSQKSSCSWVYKAVTV